MWTYFYCCQTHQHETEALTPVSRLLTKTLPYLTIGAITASPTYLAVRVDTVRTQSISSDRLVHQSVTDMAVILDVEICRLWWLYWYLEMYWSSFKKVWYIKSLRPHKDNNPVRVRITTQLQKTVVMLKGVSMVWSWRILTRANEMLYRRLPP